MQRLSRGERWHRSHNLAHAVLEQADRPLLLPGGKGFVVPSRKDGPVVSLSY